MLVKTFMSDTGLQQAPLCFLPQHRAVRVVGVPRGCLPKSLPTDEQIENWLRLATELDKPTYALRQAAFFTQAGQATGCPNSHDGYGMVEPGVKAGVRCSCRPRSCISTLARAPVALANEVQAALGANVAGGAGGAGGL